MTNPVEYPTAEWSSWVDSMNVIKQELYRLGAKRAIFKAHNEALEASPVDDATGVVHQWIRENYVDSMLIHLRRLLDTRRGTISLPNVLEGIVKNNALLSFDRYQVLWEGSRLRRSEERARDAYSKFSEDGRNFNGDAVHQDLRQLREQHAKILAHINDTLAHWRDPTRPRVDPAPEPVTYRELNRLFDDVCAVFHRYYEFLTLSSVRDFEPQMPAGFHRAFTRMVNTDS